MRVAKILIRRKVAKAFWISAHAGFGNYIKFSRSHFDCISYKTIKRLYEEGRERKGPMERIYKIATGDFVDLNRIIAIGKLVKYGNGVFEIPIYCELHSGPILILFLSDGDGAQPDEGLEEVTKIRDEIINEWKKWIKQKNENKKTRD